jgi:hypothetical protein
MVWVVNATPRPLYPRERDPVHFVQEAGWAPGPFWTCAENFASTGIRFLTRPVHSEWLYRLSPPGSLFLIECVNGITDYGLDGPGPNPGFDEIFRPSRPAMGPTQPPVQWVPRLSSGGKVRPGRAADHSPPF